MLRSMSTLFECDFTVNNTWLDELWGYKKVAQYPFYDIPMQQAMALTPLHQAMTESLVLLVVKQKQKRLLDVGLFLPNGKKEKILLTQSQ